MKTEHWLCPLCADLILDHQPVVRIAADSAVSCGRGFESLTNREVLVFSVFHAGCVIATMNNTDCDEVEYIDEARDILREAALCACCREKIFEGASDRPALTVLDGGLSS